MVLVKAYNKKELETILDICPDLAWIKDEEDKIVYVNNSYAKTFEKEKKDIIGKFEQDICQGRLAGEKITVGTEVKYFEVNEKIIYDEDKPIGKMGIATEVTADYKLAQKFEEFYEEILGNMSLNELGCEEIDMEEEFGQAGEIVFDCMRANGIVMVTWDEQSDDIKVSLKRNQCAHWQKGKELSIVCEYTYHTRNNIIAFEKPIETIKLEEGRYKQLLKNNAIELVVEYPMFFMGSKIGAVYSYYRKKEGYTVDTAMNMRRIMGYIPLMFKNIKLSAQLAHQNEKMLQTYAERDNFFQTTAELIMLIDEKKWSLQCLGNQWEKSLGWNKYELLDWTLAKICPLEDIQKIQRQLEAAKIGKEKVFCELKCLNKNKEYNDILWNISYLEDKSCYILIGKDITQTKKKEVEKLTLQKALEVERINKNLLCHMSSTFKKPVNDLLAYIEGLEQSFKEEGFGQTDLNVRKYIEMLKQNTYRLIKLINNLVDSKSIEVGAYNVHKVSCDMVELIEKICESIHGYMCEKNIHFTFKSEVQSIKLLCDPEKIERVMLNLISNAIKYTAPHGNISIYMKIQEGALFIYVMDNGEGISAKRLPNIFTRFNHDEDYFRRKQEGSGIGLSIVKSLVEMHEGQILVNSQEGFGSEFIVKLPIEQNKQLLETMQAGHNIKNKARQPWNIEFSDIYKYNYKMG